MTSPRAARPPIPEPGPPYAEVERADRWTWTVRLYRRRGVSSYGYRRVWGSRARADRIAARMLRRHIAREATTAGTAHEVEL